MDFSEDVLIEGFEVHTDANSPFFLGTTTIPAHQGVGSSTFEMTPSASMQLSSFCTLGRSGNGTCLVVYSE